MVKDHSDSERGNLPPPHDRITHNMAFVYTSREALAGMRNSSMGPPWRIDPTTHRTMSERSYHRATSRSYLINVEAKPQNKENFKFCRNNVSNLCHLCSYMYKCRNRNVNTLEALVQVLNSCPTILPIFEFKHKVNTTTDITIPDRVCLLCWSSRSIALATHASPSTRTASRNNTTAVSLTRAMIPYNKHKR